VKSVQSYRPWSQRFPKLPTPQKPFQQEIRALKYILRGAAGRSPPPQPNPIDDNFNFDDGTPQGWKVGNVNLGSLICACAGADDPDIMDPTGFFAHSEPYVIRPGITYYGAHVFGAAKFYDFRQYTTIIITNWVYAFYYAKTNAPNLRCFDCDTLAEVFSQLINFDPGTWFQHVNDVSSECRGRRICVTFSKGYGSEDYYMDDIRIQAT